MRTLNVLLALLVSAALAFGVFEGGLRLLGFGPPAINTEFDPELGWRARPGTTIERSAAEYDVTLRTDALGLRDDFTAAPPPPKPAGTFRVLCLGDSFVNGYTVDRDDLFVDLLEGAYRREGRPIDVVNAGVQGYSTDQQLLWLRRHGAALAPDLVLAFPYENDIWWNAQGRYLDEPKPLLGDDGLPVAGHTLVEPPARSWFGRTAVGNLGRLFESVPTLEVDGAGVPVEMTSRLTSPPAATLAAEARTAALVRALAAEAEALGARFALCPIPSRAQVEAAEDAAPADAPTDPARPYRVLRRAGQDLGAGTLDLVTALRAAARDGGRPYYAHDFHLNPEGNAVVAATLYEALDRVGLVPPIDDPEAAAPPARGGAGKGGGLPRWPFWYAGLTLLLGLLYTRTYPDEATAAGFLKVALLLGVVFATALGVGALLGALPPTVGRVLLAALVIALLTFVAYKLGDRVGTIGELLKAFTLRGHWYLMPLLSVLLTVGSLLVVAASSPLVAPFIYTLF